MGLGAPQIEGRGIGMEMGAPQNGGRGVRMGLGASGWGWGRRDGDGGVGMGMGALLIESTGVWMGLETPEVEVGGGLDGDGGSPDPG